jgi:hypothetical protein
MILLKDLLSEKVTDVQWLGKAYDFAMQNQMFPITPTIANILYKGKRIRVFHITSLAQLDKLNGLVGSKKAISTMTRVPYSKIRDGRIYGVHNSGVMFYLEGTLMLNSSNDIDSEPDEQGRRWFHLPYDGGIQDKWFRIIDKDTKLDKISIELLNLSRKKGKVGAERGELLRQYMDRYVELAEAFAKKNGAKIVDAILEDVPFLSKSDTYDELIVNQIKLIDAIWDGKDRYGLPIKDTKKKKAVETQLKGMVTGKVAVLKSDDSDELDTFVTSRSGKIS